MTQPSSSGRQRPVAKPVSAPAGAKPPAPPAATKPAAPKSQPLPAAAPAKPAAPQRTPTSEIAPAAGKVRTGAHPPIKGGAPPRTSPGRQNTSDRQGGGKGGRPARGRTGPSIALRMKFMLVMAGVTAVTMILLGLMMGRTANKYVYGQKTLDGIETARMAVQVAKVVKEHMDQLRLQTMSEPNNKKDLEDLRTQIAKDIPRHFKDATFWGGSDSNTDVQGILIDCPDIPELSRLGFGDDNGTGIRRKVERLFIPKRDRDLPVPDDITIYEGTKQVPGGAISILRFKISLPADPPPKGFGRVKNANNEMEPANVRIDIAMESIDKVRSNLASTIAIAVIVAIALVLGIAHWLATSITRPLETLLRDMQVVSKGNLAHRTSATSTDEVGLLASEFNQMTESLQDAQAAVIEQEKAAYELSLAREVQQQLLPAQPPLITGWQCQSFYQGAKAVSGDYFDFIPLGNGLWGFIIADVSGKGIPGSMVMAVTRTVVRLVALQHGAHADATLKDTNRLIAKQIKRGMFVTACYAVLDEATGLLSYASAGHNPMVIYRAKTKTAELATTKGIALGFNEGPIFDRTIQLSQLQLDKGDAIVLYTDGFPEAMNAVSEEFGDENFYRLIARNGHLDPQGLIEALVAGIAAHRGDAEQSDDLTLLTVRRG